MQRIEAALRTEHFKQLAGWQFELDLGVLSVTDDHLLPVGKQARRE
jgi:hypothetical protein